MQKISYLLFLTVFSLAVVGCATTPEESYSSDTYGYTKRSVASNLRYNDIPVPSNFSLITSKSLAVENLTTRVSSLYYKGRGSRIEIINFFKDNMESFGWQLINLIEGKQAIMNYTNGDEICTVIMTDSGSDITLNISLSPESKKVTP